MDQISELTQTFKPNAEKTSGTSSTAPAIATDSAAAPKKQEKQEGSKAAAKKAAKKAEKAASKAANAAAAPAKPATAPSKPKAKIEEEVIHVDHFKQGWLKGVYGQKPIEDVRTRFPPEPNGYLHIGHAKAITVNFGFAESYGGNCNLRFDDTNPAKEEEKFFTSIQEMVHWLGFQPAKITHSSDEFDQLYRLAEELIQRGKAYVCFCSASEVKQGRGGKEHGPRNVCQDWNSPVERNLMEFRAMRDGKYQAGEAHLRMKQYLGTKSAEYEVGADDTAEVRQEKARLKALANNPALWDCAAYRIKKDNYHHRTGTKWRIYPTYEFTHCLCDSFEGITHSLCTVEFETLRPAYDWLLEALDHKLPASDEKGPMQREYGRLNIEGTILSKRKIQMLVAGASVSNETAANGVSELADDLDEIKLEEDGDEEPEIPASNSVLVAREIPPAVNGWDDPRLFTLVALRRRGVPPGALKKFVFDLGVTKTNSNTKIHILDASIRSYLERTVPRLMLVLDPIKVTFTNLADNYLEERDVPFDPKDPEKGVHKVPFTKIIYIERDDFRIEDDKDFFRLSPGQSVSLLNVEHSICCKSFSTDPLSGQVTEIEAEYGAEVKKSKTRIHWVGESVAHHSPIKTEVRIYNALFKEPEPNKLNWKDGSYYDDLNPNSLVTYPNSMLECGFEYVRDNAPWPKEEGEAKGTKDNSSVRFQAQRVAYFALDKDATADKVILNRIVSLKEDSGKK
nr:putative glutamine--trna ligase [Quercus suber]POE94775.1 putative glutamine--trna ligase [Quercus suber]